MAIVILGWGSLIWDPRDLPFEGQWHRGGPELPIEFSRVSADGRLTLVIDQAAGVPVTTRYALSTRARIDAAIADLAEREGTSENRIGFLAVGSNECFPDDTNGQKAICAAIKTWCQSHRFDGAIWTALPSNFQSRTRKPFTPENAVEYLRTLSKEARSAALRYINSAPEEVVTPVRTASGSIDE